MSKIVFVHRVLSFAQSAHVDGDTLDWFNQAFKALSPYWNGKIVGTGLTTAEQRLLMPYLHGVEPDDKEFRKTTETFFHEILTKVPPQGLKLEIGLEQDNEPISKDNMPLNIQDYVIYRHALGNRQVAKSKAEADRDPTKKFYVQDPDAITTAGVEINALEDKAISCYFKYKDDELKVDQILTLLGISTKGKPQSERVMQLKRVSKRTEGKTEIEQRNELQRFIDVCEDQDLAMKYLIQELIGAQILERAGTNIIIRESGQLLGSNLKEATIFLKNPKNSKVYNMLRGQYQTVVRKDAVVPEPQNVEIPEGIDPPEETGRNKPKPFTE
jgi:hypothetical protein